MLLRILSLIPLFIAITTYSFAINVEVPNDYPTFAAALTYLNGYGGSHTITLTEDGYSEDFTVSPGAWSSLTIDGGGYDGAYFCGDITLQGGPVIVTNFEEYDVGTIYCLTGSEGSVIQNNLLWDSDVSVEDVSNITISGNTIWYHDPSITVKGNGIAVISNNYLGIGGGRTGVIIQDHASATITGNGFDSDPIINVDTSSGNMIIENNYRTGYGGGVIYNVSASNDIGIIRGNTIEYSWSYGIHIIDGTPLVEGNTIVDGESFGIVVGANSNPDFGGGARGSTGGNTIHGNDGSDMGVDVKNNSPNDIFCEDNNWGASTMSRMSGHTYADTDIDPEIEDHWENPNHGYIMWNDPGSQAIESASLGEIKAVFTDH